MEASFNNIDRWKRAVAVLDGRAKPPLDEEDTVPSLPDWLHSQEAATAGLLLASLQHTITIAETEACMGKASRIELGPDGFVHERSVVGEAAAYTSEKPVREPINIDEVIVFAEANTADLNSGEDIVELLREKLNELAEEVFEKARRRIAVETAAQERDIPLFSSRRGLPDPSGTR